MCVVTIFKWAVPWHQAHSQCCEQPPVHLQNFLIFPNFPQETLAPHLSPVPQPPTPTTHFLSL